jgi:hypothetical protein
MSSDALIYIPDFMKIVPGMQVILRLFPKLGRCVGISDGPGFIKYIVTMVSGVMTYISIFLKIGTDCQAILPFSLTMSNAVMLVFLMQGTCEICC